MCKQTRSPIAACRMYAIYCFLQLNNAIFASTARHVRLPWTRALQVLHLLNIPRQHMARSAPTHLPRRNVLLSLYVIICNGPLNWLTRQAFTGKTISVCIPYTDSIDLCLGETKSTESSYGISKLQLLCNHSFRLGKKDLYLKFFKKP